jgi:hypothetical protein
LAHEDKIILYTTNSGKVTVSVRFEDENFWMTQKAIAELFETTTANISIHIKNILDDEELDSDSTIKDFLIVQTEGSREVIRKVQFYSLDMIIAIGYYFDELLERIREIRASERRAYQKIADVFEQCIRGIPSRQGAVSYIANHFNPVQQEVSRL